MLLRRQTCCRGRYPLTLGPHATVTSRASFRTKCTCLLHTAGAALASVRARCMTSSLFYLTSAPKSLSRDNQRSGCLPWPLHCSCVIDGVFASGSSLCREKVAVLVNRQMLTHLSVGRERVCPLFDLQMEKQHTNYLTELQATIVCISGVLRGANQNG